MIRKILFKIKRKIHKITVYRYPDSTNGWKKYPDPLLGGEDHGIYFDPCVRYIQDKFVMYVSHRDSKSIVRCESHDGIHWSDPLVILRPENDSNWCTSVNRASVLYIRQKWYIWYTGMTDTCACIGLATSVDGKNFVNSNLNPILVPEKKYEKNAVMNPCVLWDDKNQIFKMWYSAGDKYEPDVLCYAISKDGIKWEKYVHNPVFIQGKEQYDKAKVGGCDIIEKDGKLIQFYIGYENIDNARICVSYSEDGINWKRDSDNPILSATKNAWDSDAVYKPTVCYRNEENKWYLWYNGRKENSECIGLATKIDNKRL